MVGSSAWRRPLPFLKRLGAKDTRDLADVAGMVIAVHNVVIRPVARFAEELQKRVVGKTNLMISTVKDNVSRQHLQNGIESASLVVQFLFGEDSFLYLGLEIIDAPQDLLVFTRRSQDELVFCVFNLGSETINWTPREGEPMKLRVGVGHGCQEGEPPMSVGSFCGYVATA